MSEGRDSAYGGVPSVDVMWLMISQLKDECEDIKSDNERLKKRVNDLESFKWWVMGVGAAIAALCTFFSDQIKVMLGLKGG